METAQRTAGLTAQFRKLGVTSSFGVDRIVMNSCEAPVVKLDLLTEDGEALAASWIRSKQCRFWRYGLPCGTSSCARGPSWAGQAWAQASSKCERAGQITVVCTLGS